MIRAGFARPALRLRRKSKASAQQSAPQSEPITVSRRTGLAESDRHRVHQAHGGFEQDHQRDQREHDGARKARELADLARAEGKPRVGGVAPREPIGERRNRQRRNVRRHVHAIGHHRHRAENRASDGLDDHHGGGERHHQPGAPFVPVVLLAQKEVRMMPLLDRVRVHGLVPSPNRRFATWIDA